MRRFVDRARLTSTSGLSVTRPLFPLTGGGGRIYSGGHAANT
jgi:hypothetical protein